VLDLGAGVVVVELAGDAPAGALEQRRDGVAQTRLAPVPHVERAGRVRRDELHVGAPARTLCRAAPGIAAREDGAHHRGDRGVGQEEVDEAGARDLHLLDQARGRIENVHERLGHVARLALERLGELKREVGGDVAVRLLAGPIESDLGVVHTELARGGFERGAELVGAGGQASVPFLGFASDFFTSGLSAGFDSAAGFCPSSPPCPFCSFL